MKTKNLFLTLAFTGIAIFLSSCSKEESNTNGTVSNLVGTYSGNYIITAQNSALKALGYSNDTLPATATIINYHDSAIMVHCIGTSFDSTLILNVFDDNDSIMACLTGTDFENHYGHMSHGGHMIGMMSGQTDWQKFCSSEAINPNDYFGMYNKANRTFECGFMINRSDSTFSIRFHGIKSSK